MWNEKDEVEKLRTGAGYEVLEQRYFFFQKAGSSRRSTGTKGSKSKEERSIGVAGAGARTIFEVLFTRPPWSMGIKDIAKSLFAAKVVVGADLVDNRKAKRMVGNV